MIDCPGSQLLEKSPILLGIFRRRKIHTVFVVQFLFTETQECAEGGIYEQGLSFQVLDRDPDWTCVENIAEKLSIGCDGL